MAQRERQALPGLPALLVHRGLLRRPRPARHRPQKDLPLICRHHRHRHQVIRLTQYSIEQHVLLGLSRLMGPGPRVFAMPIVPVTGGARWVL
jgi:hypothetical protein